MSREAVLLQWERKIEAADRLEREDQSPAGPGTVEELRPSEDATHSEPRRFERRVPTPPAPASAPMAERRTITITGQPTAPRRRRSMIEGQMAQPDRIALWAFLLGLFLVAVAAGTAQA